MKFEVITKAFKRALVVILSVIALGCAQVASTANPPAAAPDPVVPGAFSPNQIPLSLDDARHLLSRTGIGVAPVDLQRFMSMDRQQAIDTVMAEFVDVPATPMPLWTEQALPLYHARQNMDANTRATFSAARDAELAQLRQWWTIEMLQTSSPQTERMVLFWHDLFATSYYGTDQQSLAMARQNRTFRSMGMGSWEALLKAMIRDSALLEYLDSGSNHKDSPNENLARELLELFTLGEGNYEESTVREAARALTGHDTDRSHNLAFHLKTWQQDRTVKSLFGSSGTHSGDDLVELILKQPASARFLTSRFWTAFVSDANPDPAWVDRMSATLRASEFDIPTLYQAMLESDEFWAQSNRGAIIKSPVDLLLGTARSLEYPKRLWHMYPSWLNTLGMDLFAPPDVSGWEEGAGFVTPGKLLNRYELVKRLIEVSDPLMSTEQGGMSMMSMMSEDNSDTQRLQVRLAAENYEGPVEYQIRLSSDTELLWESEPTVFPYGHDTERFGMLVENSEYVWVTQAVVAPDSALDAATVIDVAFLNDAGGPGGDRNLYVDGVQIDQHWISGVSGVQESGCAPELPANSWRLYCSGKVAFSIPDKPHSSTPSTPDWSASAVHVEWADDNPALDVQNIYITLDHFRTDEQLYQNFQFSLATNGQEPINLRLETFGCWPSCVQQWAECAWTDEHFAERKTLVFPMVERNSRALSAGRQFACHRDSLNDAEKIMVSALWRSIFPLLETVEKTVSARPFVSTIDKVKRKLAESSVKIGDSPYNDTVPLITVSSEYRPVAAPLKQLRAKGPVINTDTELVNALQNDGISLYALLAPELGASQNAGLSVQGVTEQAEFQLK